MAPELQQNLFYTIYFTLAHNFMAIFYFLALMLSTLYSLYRPTRKATFFMIGFAALLFGFEYSKHIVEGLKEQTVNSLITENPHYRLQRALDISLSKIIPLFLDVVGFFSIVVAVVLEVRDRRKHKVHESH